MPLWMHDFLHFRQLPLFALPGIPYQAHSPDSVLPGVPKGFHSTSFQGSPHSLQCLSTHYHPMHDVEKNFSSYIASQVFKETSKPEKIYFSLKPCEEGYSLVAADSDSNKTYAWISSLSKRFSLVEMIATGIVYVKDTRTNTYQPFISGKGKYCKYDKEKGILVEI